VIALTKSDLVDSDTRELARMELEEFVKGTFLASSQIVERQREDPAWACDREEGITRGRARNKRQGYGAIFPTARLTGPSR